MLFYIYNTNRQHGWYRKNYWYRVTCCFSVHKVQCSPLYLYV